MHDPVVVPAGMHPFAPNASFKLSKSVRCNVLFDYWIQVCLELRVNAQVRHSNIFRTSWFCKFCARFFEVNLRCRQIWRGAAAGHSEPLRSTGNAAGNSFSKVVFVGICRLCVALFHAVWGNAKGVFCRARAALLLLCVWPLHVLRSMATRIA